MKHLTAAALLLSLAGCSTTVASTHPMGSGKSVRKQEPEKLASACKLTMSQAIDAALKKVDGKALHCGIELEDGQAVFEVKVFSNGKLYEVEIDAATGAVIEVEEDDDDDDEEDDD
jgi:uncharacterized membrane protein YkoI